MTEGEKYFFSAKGTICLSVGSCPSERCGIFESFYSLLAATL